MEDIIMILASGLTGAALGAIVVALTAGRALRPKGCPHDHLLAHSTERYANVTYIWAVCQDCSKPLKFDLGFCASTQGAQMEAAKAVLNAKGYRLVGGSGNIFERKREN